MSELEDVKLLTVQQAAEIMNTPERFVRRLIEERRIAFHKLGRYVRISEAEVLAFIDAGAVARRREAA